jgi:virginiamycin A acetyltransferase
MAARAIVKGLVDSVAMALVSPAALTCKLESALSDDAESVFAFWAQCFAVVPGPLGLFVRRAFYRWTLQACGSRLYVAFGTVFTHREVIVEDDVYIGCYALIGCARLGRGALIGSRASLLSGPALHEFNERDGRWLPSIRERRQQIAVGAHAWIGEGAILMANVGDGAMVAAGSVVSSPVPARVVVAGNPARFVRRLTSECESHSGEAAVQR